MTGSEKVGSHLPLSEVALEILLALSKTDQHGYAIMSAVKERTGGRVSLHAGTLYRALARMLDTGLLEELPAEVGEDSRRRRYRMTDLGREVAAAEVDRIASQVAAARASELAGERAKG